MAEPLDLDPELFRKIRARQKLRRAHTVKDLRAFFKVGSQADYDKRRRELLEEAGALRPLIGQQQQEEQYYFGREFEARMNAMNQAIATAKAQLSAELSKYGVSAGSAQAAAANSMRALFRNMTDNQGELGMLQDVSPKTGRMLQNLEAQGVVGRSRAMTGDAAKGLAMQQLQGLKEVMQLAQAGDPRVTPTDVQNIQEELRALGVDPLEEDWERDYVNAQSRQLQAEDWTESQQGGGQEAATAPEYRDPRSPEVQRLLHNVIRDNPDNRAQAGADALAVLNRLGIPADEALQQLAQDPTAEILAVDLQIALAQNREKKQELTTTLEQQANQLEKVARQTWPSSRGVQAAMQNLTQVTSELTTPQEAPGAPGADEEADPRAQDFFNIMQDPSGGALERLTRVMDAIEEYPELPPAEDLKKQIMESDKFRTFMEARGLPAGSEQMAFRLMNREARNVQRQSNKFARKRIQELKSSGAILGKDAADVNIAETVKFAEPSEQLQNRQDRVADRIAQKAQNEL